MLLWKPVAVQETPRDVATERNPGSRAEPRRYCPRRAVPAFPSVTIQDAENGSQVTGGEPAASCRRTPSARCAQLYAVTGDARGHPIDSVASAFCGERDGTAVRSRCGIDDALGGGHLDGVRKRPQ